MPSILANLLLTTSPSAGEAPGATSAGRAFRKRLRHTAGRGLRRSPIAVQNAIRRGSRTVLAALGPEAQNGQPVTGISPVYESPPVPLPEGLSLQDLERTYYSWSVDREPVGHLDGYFCEAIWRFLYTWRIVRDDTGACLELGANPYFTTYLLDRHTRLDLTLANYFGEAGECTQPVSYVPPGSTERVEVERRSRLFNIEEDVFPYDADTFDVVLFCEILEHLLMDPVAVLRQIHRVLKPGGILVLTTPNVARLENVLALLNGANIYDPYSGYGPYGRHNREYNRHELHRLLDFTGFDVESSFTADGHLTEHTRLPGYDLAAPLVDFRRQDLGQYLFVRAQARRPPRDALPSFLYRSRPEGEIIAFD
jgi:SAM-dependent methyltransferase